MHHYFVVDLGGTNIKYGLANQAGTLLFTDKFPTPTTLAAFLEILQSTYEKLKTHVPFAGIAISSPGAIDTHAGVVHGTSAIPYIHEIPLVDMIAEKLDHLPISIENDANSAALGEFWRGEGQGYQNMASVVCGSGIGGGVIMDGTLWRGTHLLGGEFGYTPMLSRDGTLKTWSDFTIVNLAKRYQEQTGAVINGYILAERSRAGEPLAVSLMEEFFLHTAMGIIMIQYAFDPEIIVFGGALSKDQWIMKNINHTILTISKGQDFDVYHPVLKACKHGNDANLLGALYQFLTKYDLLEAEEEK